MILVGLTIESILPTVPNIASSSPGPLQPIHLVATPTPEDFAEAELRIADSAIANRRRRLLTVVLPLFWCSTLLIAFAFWKDAAGTFDAHTFLRDLRQLPLTPLWVLLAGVTGILLLMYATYRWRVQRRVRHVIRHEVGIRHPIRVDLTIDANGLATFESDRSAFTPWDWVSELAEDDQRFFFLLRFTGLPVIIPKRDLKPDESAGVRRYASLIGAETQSRLPAAPSGAARAVELSYRHTVEHQTDLVLHNEQQPQVRRLRLQSFATVFLLALLVYPALMALLWVLDPYRVPLAEAFPLFIEETKRNALYQIGLAFLVVAALALFRRAILRSGARLQAAAVVARRHHDDNHVIIDDSGVSTRQGNAFSHFSWRSIQGAERTPSLIILQIRQAMRFIMIPRASLSEPSSKILDDLLSSHLASRKDAA